MQILHITIIYWLVALSILTSIVASYAAFGFAERVATSTGKSYWLWLTGGAFAMGLGIWSMHYLGMLAVHLPIDVVYHVPTVILSFLLAVLASAAALQIISKDHLQATDLFAGSLMMGGGIGAMHYVGIHAMRCNAMHRYNPGLVVLSVVVAVAFSRMALQILYTIRRRSDIQEWLRLVGAALMGLGIAAMHYTAMAAVTFERTTMHYFTANTIGVSTIGVAAIVFTATIVLFGALVTTLLDRRGYENLQKVLEQLSEERDRFSAAAESSMDALYICSAVRGPAGEIEDFLFTYLNNNVEKMIAIPRGQLLGHTMLQVLPIDLSLAIFDHCQQVVLSGDPFADEFAVRDKDIAGVWFRVQIVKVRDGVAITASDITERKRNEERILHLAHHDPLTGLLNRTLLNDRMSQAIEHAKRYGKKIAVFLVDLDRFKEINDTLGHAAGDHVLLTIGRRLREVVRATDSIVRIGGDEFVLIIGELVQHADAEVCGTKLVAACNSPIVIGDALLTVTCSVGGVVYPDLNVADPDQLIAKADLALYTAKANGKNQFHLYSAELLPLRPVHAGEPIARK